jgi:hypothetical protein
MFYQYNDVDAIIVSDDITLRTKSVLNADGFVCGRACDNANVPPTLLIKENDFIITSKQFEQHPEIFNNLILMCEKGEIGRVLYNEGDNVVVMYP